ncbi:hypothetical protein V501_01228, partial [Pseudogymnoascus sp. VKM F-4519 (FW-2642)]
KRRRAKQARLQQGGSLSFQEAEDLIAENEVDKQIKEETSRGSRRTEVAEPRTRRCGICSNTGHNARTCQVVVVAPEEDDSERLNNMGLLDRLKKKAGSHGAKRAARGSPASATIEQISTSAPVSAEVPTKLPPERAGPPVTQLPSRSQSPSHLSTTTLSIRPADQLSASATPSMSDSLDLWKLAYDQFRKESPQELLLGYDTHVLGSAPVDADLSSRESIETALEKLLKDRENRQWKVSIRGRDVNIRAQVVRLTKILEWSDPLVKSAVSTQPYAALAWSGVSLLLPLLTRGTTENEAMLEGFSSIGELQQFWQIQEKISLQSKHQHHYQSLTERLVKLYSLFFTYQAYVICHLSKTQFSRAWEDLSSPGFWTSKVEEIDSWSKIAAGSSVYLVKARSKRIGIVYSEAAGDYERYKDLNPKRVLGTCEWFLKDERFCKWRDNATSSLLWVSAGPGRGKSVLSKCLIDEDQLATTTITITPSSNKPATSRRSTICYFFFKDGGDGPMDSAQALCALLHQLFTCPSTSRLIKYALESYQNNERTLTKKPSELWKILLACVTSPDSGEIICVLDALDECKNESGQKLIKTLEEFYSRSARPLTDDSKLKFLVTSRPYDNLESSFRKFPKAVYLRFDGDDKSKEIQKEIDLVIDDRVPHITSGFADTDQQKIGEYLKSMEHRTYLWLHLTFDIIEKRPNPKQEHEPIMDEDYPSNHTSCSRPLTLDETNVALALAIRKEEPESQTKLKSELWPADKFQSVVTNLCGLFVSVYDSKLSLIHQTAREFLMDSESVGTWKGKFNMAQSHHSLSRYCISYLLLPDINVLIDGDGSTRFPFHAYAANAWPLHFVSQNAVGADSLLRQARTLCNTTRHRLDTWVSYYFKQRHEGWIGLSDLALASCLGLLEVVEDILFEEKSDVDLETTDERGRTSLLWAATKGHEVIAKVLLENGAEIEARDNPLSQTSLSVAARGGHKAVVELLLKNEADIEAKDKYGQTPLLLAASGGHEAVIELLLKNEADIEAKDHNGRTLLLLAAEGGHEAVVDLLLKNEADIEAKDHNGRTLLLLAAKGGHEAVVKLLLKNEVDIDAKDGYGQTPLLLAAWNGSITTVKLLLEGGADIEVQDGSDWTPLTVAITMGHKAIVKLLLGEGANIEVKGDKGQKLLLLAAKKAYDAIVALLPEEGVDTKPWIYCTLIAERESHEAIVELLLEMGVKIEVQDFIDQTPVSADTEKAREAVVELLLSAAEENSTE